MNCDQMDSLLSAYIDDELGAQERKCIEEHLSECVRCQQSYEVLCKLHHAMASLPAPPAPKEHYTSLREAIAACSAAERRKGRRQGSSKHNCEAVQKRMMMLLDDKLPVDESHALFEQIARCDNCTQVWAQWQAYQAALQRMAKFPAPAERKAMLLTLIREQSGEVVQLHRVTLVETIKWLWQHRVRWLVAGSFVAVLLIALVVTAIVRNAKNTQTLIAGRSKAPRMDAQLQGGISIEGTANENERVSRKSSQMPSKGQPLASQSNITRRAAGESSVAKVLPKQPGMPVAPRLLTKARVTAAESPRMLKVAQRHATQKAGKSSRTVGELEGVEAKDAMTGGDRVILKVEGKSSLSVSAVKMALSMRRQNVMHLASRKPVHVLNRRPVQQREDGKDIPSPESRTVVASAGQPVTHGTKMEMPNPHRQSGVAKKVRPVYGIGVASGKYAQDELYRRGGLPALRGDQEPLQRMFVLLGKGIGDISAERDWGKITGAAFRPHFQEQEIARLRSYLSWRAGLRDELRSPDMSKELNPSRTFCLKLFQLGVRW